MRLALLILVLVISIRICACDICGGVSSNASIGLFASTKYHMFGVKSGLQSFSSFMDGIVHSREYIQRNELNFRFQFHQRLQIMGFVPQQFAIQKRDLGSDYVQGIGDPMILINGIVLHKNDTNGRSIHFLSLGMGIKFPIGRVGSSNSAIKNLYPGTGALEEMIILNYTRSFKRIWGLQNEVSYAIKQRNKDGYKYGNSSQISISVVNNSKLGFRRIISSAGIVYSHFQPSYLNGEQLILNNNKGFVLAPKLGVHIMGYNWLFSIQGQVPVYQNLNNRSIKQKFGIEAGLTYLLKTKIKKT